MLLITYFKYLISIPVERDGKLNDLLPRSELLMEQANTFNKNSDQLQKKYFWENKKMKIIIGVTLSVIILIIIIVIAVVFTRP